VAALEIVAREYQNAKVAHDSPHPSLKIAWEDVTQEINNIINTNSRYSAEEHILQHQRQMQLQEEIRLNREHQDLHGVREGQGQQLMFLQQQPFKASTSRKQSKQKPQHHSNLQESYGTVLEQTNDVEDPEHDFEQKEELQESLQHDFLELEEMDNMEGSPLTSEITTQEPLFLPKTVGRKRAQSGNTNIPWTKRRKSQ